VQRNNYSHERTKPRDTESAMTSMQYHCQHVGPVTGRNCRPTQQQDLEHSSTGEQQGTLVTNTITITNLYTGTLTSSPTCTQVHSHHHHLPVHRYTSHHHHQPVHRYTHITITYLYTGTPHIIITDLYTGTLTSSLTCTQAHLTSSSPTCTQVHSHHHHQPVHRYTSHHHHQPVHRYTRITITNLYTGTLTSPSSTCT